MTDPKYSEVMNALDILMEDLTPQQLELLKELAEDVKDPTHIKASEAKRIVQELGIDIEAIQKKNGEFRTANKKPKRKPNEPCHCGSGKKWKKCCRLKDLEQ